MFAFNYNSEGNNYFKNKEYAAAIDKYSEAIKLDPSDVTFYSNRSACYAALNQWAEAADDGKQCIITDKNFVKGYFRHALALQNLDNLDGALESGTIIMMKCVNQSVYLIYFLHVQSSVGWASNRPMLTLRRCRGSLRSR